MSVSGGTDIVSLPTPASVADALDVVSLYDEIPGGFAIVDTAPNVVAALSTLNADSQVASISVTSGGATLSGGAVVDAPSFSETGSGTSLTISENLGYAGAFSQGAGSTLSISSGDTVSLTGTASLSGTTSGAGTLALAGGSATIDSGAVSVSNLSISGSGASVTLGKALTYAGTFTEAAGDTLALTGGALTLTGAHDAFSGGTVDGSKILSTEGTTAVSGLTIGGTVEWKNTKAVNESGGSATIGDASGDEAFLDNTANGTYDILDNSGIGLGASTASYIDNAGLFEKTGGTGASAIAPAVINTGTIKVTAATLDMQGAVTGKGGSDEISGASTLEFDSTVVANQTVSFTGSGGTLDLTDPQGFVGEISGFDTVGANDAIEVASPWVFSGFTENSGGTQGTLGFINGASHHNLTLLGDYNPADFVQQTLANGSTLITYT